MDVENPLGTLPGVEDVLRRSAVWAEVPAGLEARVLSGPAEQPPVRRLRPRLLVAAAIGTAALAAGVTAILTAGPDAGTMELSGTPIAAQAHADVQLRDTPSGVEIVLDVEGLPPAPEGSYYQGWVKGDRGVVAIGTFHLRRGGDDVVLWSGVELSGYPAITVTLQAEGAGPASSGKVVLRGDVPPALR